MYTNKHARLVYHIVVKQTNMPYHPYKRTSRVRRSPLKSVFSNKIVRKARTFKGKVRAANNAKPPAKVARQSGLLRNIHEQTFKQTIGYCLQIPDWDWQNNIDNTRHYVEAVFQKLSGFEGFTETVARYEQVRPMTMSIKIRLAKNAFGPIYTGGNPALPRPNQSAPGIADNVAGTTGGNIPSMGAFSYAEVLACVDYDGLKGQGDTIQYKRSDFRNAGNSSQTYITGGVPRLIAKYPLKQYIRVPTTGQIAVGISQDQQWFSSNVFNDLTATNATALPNQPQFGGCNFAVISYDAMGNGYTGSTQDHGPCLGTVVEYEIKVQFKGEVKK